MKRTGPTNILVRKLSDELIKLSKKENAPVWRSVSEILVKPTRDRVAVNVSKINRYAREGEIVIVPGKVLGAGRLEKKVTVAALSFSKTAIEKIRAAGGEPITISEAMRKYAKGSNTRIIM